VAQATGRLCVLQAGGTASKAVRTSGELNRFSRGVKVGIGEVSRRVLDGSSLDIGEVTMLDVAKEDPLRISKFH
jgi:hypothetical protein